MNPKVVERITESIARWHAQTKAPKAEATTIRLDDYTPGARDLVRLAQSLADERHHEETTSIHLLVRLLVLPAVQERWRAAGSDPVAALDAAEKILRDMPISKERAYVSADFASLLQRARAAASGETVSLANLLTAALSPPRLSTLEDLDKHGLTGGEEERRAAVITAGRLDRAAGR